MELLQIVSISCMVMIFSLVIKRDRPELALLLSMALAAMIFFIMLGKLKIVWDLFQGMAERAHIHPLYLQILLKVMGIAYIAEFGAQICRDAGEGTIAGKIEFAGKIFIVILAVPLISQVLESIGQLLP